MLYLETSQTAPASQLICLGSHMWQWCTRWLVGQTMEGIRVGIAGLAKGFLFHLSFFSNITHCYRDLVLY